MSTQINHYVILGVKLPYDKSEGAYEKYEKYMDSAFAPRTIGLVVLFDGRDGRYIIIGYVMASTDESGSFYNPVTLKSIDERTRKSVATDLKNHFGIVDQEIAYHVVSHYR